MKLTLIIPAHNEEEVIGRTIEELERTLDFNYEIIVINDHSTDRTESVVKKLTEVYKNIIVVNNNIGRGFADALRNGFSVADSDFVIPVMADLCDDPRTIKEMYDLAVQGYDIVCGSRYMSGGGKSGGPFIQSFFSRFAGLSLMYILGVPTRDISNSFKCYSKEVLKQAKTISRGFEISMELALKAFFLGFKITEIPTVWKGRFIGKSKFYLFKVIPLYSKIYFWALFGKKEKNRCVK
jgi:glycosyltransferase involved in cell wall biosynthesis